MAHRFVTDFYSIGMTLQHYLVFNIKAKNKIINDENSGLRYFNFLNSLVKSKQFVYSLVSNTKRSKRFTKKNPNIQGIKIKIGEWFNFLLLIKILSNFQKLVYLNYFTKKLL